MTHSLFSGTPAPRTVPIHVSSDKPLFAPAAERLVNGRPVLSREELTALGEKLLGMTNTKTSTVFIEHKLHSMTRMSNGEVLTSDDGDFLTIAFDRAVVDGNVQVNTNQVTDATLRQIVKRFDEIRRDWGESEAIMPPMTNQQDTFVPVQLWHESTIQALRDASVTVLPEILQSIENQGLRASGFFGFLAKSQIIFTHDHTSAFCEQTDCELAIIARSQDGKSSGWGGQSARDWSQIDVDAVVARAVDVCKRSAGAQALEPGRRVAILTAEAVVQLMRFLAPEFDAAETIEKRNTPFYSPTKPSRARYGERMFDPRITMSSNPADPDGGYVPYFWWAFANAPVTWVENGKLKELAWQPYTAVYSGRTHYSDLPYSIRISGGDTTVDEMIAQCEEGIFVNRFSGVELLAIKTGTMTGVTRDGCFLVKNGKINRPVKNFRFLDSPFFMLNKIMALGKTKRAAFGYTPPSHSERLYTPEWPRPPIIVPPMMVRDFNFNALADAV
jgi:predicted Zn-dependent protease